MLPVVFLSRRYRDGQPILRRRQRAGRVRSHRARRIVSVIKINHNGPMRHRISLKKATAGISVRLFGEIVEDKKQPLGSISTNVSKPVLMAIDLKNRRPRDWNRS